MANNSFSRLPVVMGRTGLGRSTVYKKIADGEFPKQVRLGPRAVGWLDEEVDAWIQARVDDSRFHDQETEASIN